MTELSREVLLPNCRIRSDNVGGSGTVIYSAPNKDGDYSTYVLTNNHVVANSIKIDKKFSPLLKRDIKDVVYSTVETHFFEYLYESRHIGTQSINSDIVTYDKDEDLALLKLRLQREVPAVAKMYPRGKERELKLARPIITIGAALGEPPIMTTGRLAQFAREIENKEYWIGTAPIIYGNSGGAVYLEDTCELIGVPARIAVAGGIFSPDAITHLGFMIPITRIYDFLENQLFRFIYDSNFTEEGEAKERERKRKEEERKMAAREDTGQEQEEQEEQDPN